MTKGINILTAFITAFVLQSVFTVFYTYVGRGERWKATTVSLVMGALLALNYRLAAHEIYALPAIAAGTALGTFLTMTLLSKRHSD